MTKTFNIEDHEVEIRIYGPEDDGQFDINYVYSLKSDLMVTFEDLTPALKSAITSIAQALADENVHEAALERAVAWADAQD